MAVAVLCRRVCTSGYQRDVGVRIMAVTLMVVFLLAVAVAVTSMIMAMMMVSKASHPYQVNSEAHRAHDEKLHQSLRLVSLRQALNRLNYNLNTNKPIQKLV